MTTHDFSDGFGAVLAHQHVNPDGTTGGWVSDDPPSLALVDDTCYMGPNTQACRGSRITGRVVLTDNAYVLSGQLSDDVRVSDNARIFGAVMSKNARAQDNAVVSGTITDSARIMENGSTESGATVSGNARVYGNATVGDGATVSDSARIFDRAVILGEHT
jgi:UDP-3-O-[3-hydroxymyristoyl] glucosamine N-acyltransferase